MGLSSACTQITTRFRVQLDPANQTSFTVNREFKCFETNECLPPVESYSPRANQRWREEKRNETRSWRINSTLRILLMNGHRHVKPADSVQEPRSVLSFSALQPFSWGRREEQGFRVSQLLMSTSSVLWTPPHLSFLPLHQLSCFCSIFYRFNHLFIF